MDRALAACVSIMALMPKSHFACILYIADLPEGFLMINLDVRATQDRAIQSFESRSFKRYATNNYYAKVGDDYVPGFYYHKEL